MKWQDLRSPEFRTPGFTKDKVVIVPVAAIEQHGDHLPVKTDTLIASALADRIEAATSDFVIQVPTLWLGASHHHLDFSGTLSLRVETYVAVIRDLVECLNRQGFKKIIFLNCHGGNCAPLGQFFSQRQENGIQEGWVVEVTYWTMNMGATQAPCGMTSARLSHACEYETSMVLHLDPRNVEMALAKADTPNFKSPYLYFHGEGPSQVRASYRFSQVTSTGAMGEPQHATAEKGEKLVQFHSKSLIDFVNDFKKWPELKSLA